MRAKWARIDGRILSPTGAPVQARLSVAPLVSPAVVTMEDGSVVLAGTGFAKADDTGRLIVDVLVGDSLPVEIVVSSPGNTIARRSVVLRSGSEYSVQDIIEGKHSGGGTGGNGVRVTFLEGGDTARIENITLSDDGNTASIP